MDVTALQQKIEALFSKPAKEAVDDALIRDFEAWFPEFVGLLTSGKIRAAEPREGRWTANIWVKKGILLGFRLGRLTEYSIDSRFRYFDKHTYPLRVTELGDGVRIVPGGTSARMGSYLAPGVVIMPPAYINVGGYVDCDTMIDSHALVGSCAQIGARVHLSAAAQVGGVLEPIGASPVVIEDDVMVGGNSGIYEGTVVRRGAVIGAGTILTSSIPVYDLVRETVLRASAEGPLTIPENAVVIPGARPAGKGEFARAHGLSAACALIVKYRDERTDAATALESGLRI
ncbi:MAG: 2,3,4,5-tetrahydropyridine-2,6-dicarboxylate N-succinyltransferase [Acidobacteriota bacterium]|jgi:2,3,4,5-tetrahydropyridine-2,6-dicarboxylate N-succinyltransferase